MGQRYGAAAPLQVPVGGGLLGVLLTVSLTSSVLEGAHAQSSGSKLYDETLSPISQQVLFEDDAANIDTQTEGGALFPAVSNSGTVLDTHAEGIGKGPSPSLHSLMHSQTGSGGSRHLLSFFFATVVAFIASLGMRPLGGAPSGGPLSSSPQQRKGTDTPPADRLLDLKALLQEAAELSRCLGTEEARDILAEAEVGVASAGKALEGAPGAPEREREREGPLESFERPVESALLHLFSLYKLAREKVREIVGEVSTRPSIASWVAAVEGMDPENEFLRASSKMLRLLEATLALTAQRAAEADDEIVERGSFVGRKAVLLLRRAREDLAYVREVHLEVRRMQAFMKETRGHLLFTASSMYVAERAEQNRLLKCNIQILGEVCLAMIQLRWSREGRQALAGAEIVEARRLLTEIEGLATQHAGIVASLQQSEAVELLMVLNKRGAELEKLVEERLRALWNTVAGSSSFEDVFREGSVRVQTLLEQIGGESLKQAEQQREEIKDVAGSLSVLAGQTFGKGLEGRDEDHFVPLRMVRMLLKDGMQLKNEAKADVHATARYAEELRKRALVVVEGSLKNLNAAERAARKSVDKLIVLETKKREAFQVLYTLEFLLFLEKDMAASAAVVDGADPQAFASGSSGQQQVENLQRSFLSLVQAAKGSRTLEQLAEAASAMHVNAELLKHFVYRGKRLAALHQ